MAFIYRFNKFHMGLFVKRSVKWVRSLQTQNYKIIILIETDITNMPINPLNGIFIKIDDIF